MKTHWQTFMFVVDKMWKNSVLIVEIWGKEDKLLHCVSAPLSCAELMETLLYYWSGDVLPPSSTDWWALWPTVPPGCIHPNRPAPDSSLSVCLLTRLCPFKHWTIRWEDTLIAPHNLPSPLWFLLCVLSRPPSLSDTLAYWFDWRRDH